MSNNIVNFMEHFSCNVDWLSIVSFLFFHINCICLPAAILGMNFMGMRDRLQMPLHREIMLYSKCVFLILGCTFLDGRGLFTLILVLCLIPYSFLFQFIIQVFIMMADIPAGCDYRNQMEELLRDAKATRRAGKLTEASKLLRRANGIDPTNYEVACLLIQVTRDHRGDQMAKQECNRVIRRGKWHDNYGMMLRQQCE